MPGSFPSSHLQRTPRAAEAIIRVLVGQQKTILWKILVWKPQESLMLDIKSLQKIYIIWNQDKLKRSAWGDSLSIDTLVFSVIIMPRLLQEFYLVSLPLVCLLSAQSRKLQILRRNHQSTSRAADTGVQP